MFFERDIQINENILIITEMYFRLLLVTHRAESGLI